MTHIIDAPPEQVLPYLFTPELFKAVHPYISETIKINDDSYLFKERIRLGVFSLPSSYIVNIQYLPSQQAVLMSATVYRLISLNFKFCIAPHFNGCLIHEEAGIKTLLPVKFLIKRIIKRAHRDMFVAIPGHLRTT